MRQGMWAALEPENYTQATTSKETETSVQQPHEPEFCQEAYMNLGTESPPETPVRNTALPTPWF